MAGSASNSERDWLAEYASMRLPACASGVIPPALDGLLGALNKFFDLVYFLDLQGRASRFSPNGAKQTGYTRNDLDTRIDFLGDLVHAEDRSAMQPTSATDFPVTGINYRLRPRDGTWRWMFSRRLVATDESGERLGFVCFDRDVTEQKSTEEKVLAERDRAREYLDIAGVILVAIDVDHNVTMINRRGCETLGYSESEILGSKWFERFVPPRDREATRSVFRQLVAGKLEPVEHYENGVIDRAGREKLIAWHNTLVRRPDGSIAGTLSSGEDITEKRRSEEMLHRTEEQFRALFEGTASCILFIEGKNVSYANEAMLKTFGYARHELIGQNVECLHLSNEKYQEAFVTAFQTVQRQGSWRGDWPLKKKDGTQVWMDNFLTRLSGGGVVAVLHDITERRQAESALSFREAELGSIFRAAPVGIGLAVDRIITQANQKLGDMLGYEREELIGQSSRFIYPDDASYEYVGDRKYRQIRETGTGTVETRWRRKDGQIIDVLLSSCPVDQDDWSKGITFTALDITERKKAEQALLDKHVALREVLNQISSDQEAIREQIATNIGEAIMPMLDRLQEHSDSVQRVIVEQLRRDFDQISSPFLEVLKNRQPRLTPRETEICRLIKNGLTSKQIADSLSISLGTVHKYRELIRRKLGLANVDVNLTSYLQSL